jgi:1-deoxyxylulose-5-phosphate synthase
VVLATKFNGRMWEGPNGDGVSRGHMMRSVEESLRRLQTDYIDLYQTHWPHYDTPQEETLRALDDLVKAGKLRYIGCSNEPAWRLTKALWISDATTSTVLSAPSRLTAWCGGPTLSASTKRSAWTRAWA